MDQSGSWILQVSLSLVIAIGVVGFTAAWLAYLGIKAERDAVRRGRNAIGNMPCDGDELRHWLKEQRLDDSHLGDHLRAAADARRSGRAISLNELHQVSARREARRRSARLSGGIAGLLLVCGIAGTLASIKPVLGAFKVSAATDGTVSGPGSVDVATRMIHDLSEAFWPSLIALGLTVIIAFVRGFYTHGRGILAGELDQFDLEDLFHRFPPPSLSQELDGVRRELADLTARMLTSQGKFDDFVVRLSDAAKGFGRDAPPLQAASDRFVDGVNALAPKMDALGKTIADHLGPTAPVVSRFDGLLAIASDVNRAATQMQMAGAILSKHLLASHQVLKTTADGLPAQLQAACQSASGIIADAASRALAAACADAVARLDAAAAPLRDAAQSVASENRALKAETSQAIADLTRSVTALCDATTEGMLQDLNTGLDAATGRVDALLTQTATQVQGDLNDAQEGFRQALEAATGRADTLLRETAGEVRDSLGNARQGFRQALDAALATITGLHSGADDAIARVADAVGRLEQVQTRIDTALQESAQTRDAIVGARGEIVAVGDRMTAMTADLDSARQALADIQQRAAATTDRLVRLAAELGTLTQDAGHLRPMLEALLRAQQETGARVDGLLKRAEQISADWQQWLPDATRLHETGDALRGDLDRLLEQGRTVATELHGAATAAAGQQQRLAQDLETLNSALGELRQLAGRGLFGRVFGNRE